MKWWVRAEHKTTYIQQVEAETEEEAIDIACTIDNWDPIGDDESFSAEVDKTPTWSWNCTCGYSCTTTEPIYSCPNCGIATPIEGSNP